MKNKINVGITTWVGDMSLNYGSMLQASAMQKLISDCGCSPITINKFLYRQLPFWELYRYGLRYVKTKYSFYRFMHKNMKITKLFCDNKTLINYAKKIFRFSSVEVMLSGCSNGYLYIHIFYGIFRNWTHFLK